MSNCPCGASNTYKLCCQKYHGGQNPKTALLLMKSRYCAFVRGEIEYIIKTTHPDNPALAGDLAKWKRELLEFSRSTQFKGLKILSTDEPEGSIKATVTFAVNLIQHGRQAGFTEQSQFEKVNGRWLYLDGVIQQQALEAQEAQEAVDFSL